MKTILGYNFMQDGDCLTPMTTAIENIKGVQIENGIFDHLNVTKDTISAYSNIIPQVWDFLTLLDANFNGNINAGNVDFVASQISSLKIKRRKVGTFNWLTLYDIPIAESKDFTFTKFDHFNENDQEYEYAFVPVINGAEGGYIIKKIISKFNGVYVCDDKSIYKFYNNVKYGTSEQVNPTAIFEPFGRKYPVVVSNSKTNYYTSNLSGTLLTNKSVDDGNLDRKAEVAYRKNVTDFLTNKKAKVIKDWNGNIWLVMITSSVSQSYYNEMGMGMADTSISFTEVGDVHSQGDLYEAGLVTAFE